MIQLIVGNKGKGKTKHLLDKVNSEIKTAHGSIVYLDKSTKHMYELNNKIRLIDVSSFPIESSDEFIGFIYGILSQDHDLEQMYLDSFLDIGKVAKDEVEKVFEKLEKTGKLFGVTFYISISVDEHELPESAKSQIIVSL